MADPPKRQAGRFVIATGEQHSVREFCQLAFRYAGIELRFEGEGENEKGIDCKSGKVLVEVSPDFYRPTDVVNLLGDPSKAKRELDWNPQKTSFEQLVKSWWMPIWQKWPLNVHRNR